MYKFFEEALPIWFFSPCSADMCDVMGEFLCFCFSLIRAQQVIFFFIVDLQYWANFHCMAK